MADDHVHVYKYDSDDGCVPATVTFKCSCGDSYTAKV